MIRIGIVDDEEQMRNMIEQNIRQSIAENDAAEIANTMKEVPVKDGKRFLTSKPDKENHGYGLKSVQRIVDEYEGMIFYEIKENEFVVTLSFFDIG